MEYGMVIPQGMGQVRKAIPRLLEDTKNVLSPLFRELLQELYDELVYLDERICSLEQKLVTLSVHMRIASVY